MSGVYDICNTHTHTGQLPRSTMEDRLSLVVLGSGYVGGVLGMAYSITMLYDMEPGLLFHAVFCLILLVLFVLLVSTSKPHARITHLPHPQPFRDNHQLDCFESLLNTATISIKFLKVKAHTGIIGNERADQIANHVAKHLEVADTGIKMAGHEGNPFHNIIWLATSTDDPKTHPIIDNGNQSQPYHPHMPYLPNKRDSLRSVYVRIQAHMHKVHKLGNAQTDTSYYTNYQNLIKNRVPIAKSVMLSGLHLASLTRKKKQ